MTVSETAHVPDDKMAVTSETVSIRNDPTEESPLLLNQNGSNEPSPETTKGSICSHPETLVTILLVLVLLVSLGDQLMQNPGTRIIESVVCYQYYEKVDPSKILIARDVLGAGAIGGVAELWCKVDAVQSEVAEIRGWQMTLNGIPGLILAVPMGWAADRYGRKPLFFIALLGNLMGDTWYQVVTWFWQAFDIRLVWLSTFFVTIGGGQAMPGTLAYVVIADISPPDKRAANFLRLAAFVISASLLMPPVAAWLMRYNPWIPSILGTGLQYFAILLYLFCPETLNFRHDSLPQRTTPDDETRSDVDASRPDELATSFGFATVARRLRTQIMKSVAFLTDDIRVPLLLPPMLLYSLYVVMPLLILQYISKRYDITFDKATFVMTIGNAMVVVLYFVILPYLSTYVMRRFSLSGQRKDLYLWRVSHIFLTMGFLLIGLSPNILLVSISLAVIALGTASAQLLRSFLTSLVPAHNVARVYSVINVIETVGIMAGSPLMAMLFRKGLSLGGGWVGLPFYFMAIAGATIAIWMFCVGLRKGEDSDVVDDES